MNELKKFSLVLLLNALLFYTCTTIDPGSILDTELESALIAASEEETMESFILPKSDDFASIPQDLDNNPLTREKVELGKMLFFETGLALNPMNEVSRGTYSCGTCHVPETGFMPGRAQGISDGGIGYGASRTKHPDYQEDEVDVQTVRPQSLLNSAFVTNSTVSGMFGAGGVNVGTQQHWDDVMTELNFLGFEGLETQNIAGLTLHRMVVNKDVFDDLGYTPLFDAAFPDFPEEERYGKITTAFAMAAYMRTLFANKAPFQKWLKGDKGAMSDQQKRGALAFFGKAKCYQCHNGPALDAVKFFALGAKDLHQQGLALNPDPEDDRIFGRGGFTDKAEDMYKFKVPQVYNMKGSPFYFHGSSINSMRGVIDYFNEAVPENPEVPVENIASRFVPLGLTESEINDLVEFMDNGLFDPDLARYVPEEVLSGNCIPSNDEQSRVDLGCD